VAKGGLGRSSGSRTDIPVREPVALLRGNASVAANDNDAPWSARLAEAARWVFLLLFLFGLGAYLWR